jgi:hypothetical protein
VTLSKPTKVTAAAAAALAIFFVATASGRVASGDAGAQLQAATLLATQGRLGIDRVADPDNPGLWVKAPNGRYYEAHDIGNVLAMAPAAALGARSSAASSDEDFRGPALLARVGTSLTFSLLGALGAFFLFLLLRRRYRPRVSLLLALGLPLTTFYWVYARAAWDVLGAGAFNAGAMYFAFELLDGRAPRRNLTLSALFVALACSFRFSLLPFLGLALLAVVVVTPMRRDLRGVAVAALVGAIALAPSFAYNAVRMGSPLRPATMARQYDFGNGLGGNFLEGFFGLLAAPNRGLFIFAPVLLLMMALPLAWSGLEGSWRRLLVTFGGPLLLYVVLIANIRGWGTFGWGPRYLVPILPFAFLIAVLAGEAIWDRRRRVVIGLAVVSAALSLAPVLVNWNATSDNDAAIVSPYTPWPRQQYEVWRGLTRAARGKNVDVLVKDTGLPGSRSAVFPDLWLVQLADRSAKAAIVAGILSVLLILSGLVVVRWFVRSQRELVQPA